MNTQLPLTLPYTLIVLCGGQGSRLGGADKGLLSVDGQPFVQRLIDRLAQPMARSPYNLRVLISANRHRDQYSAFGYPVIADIRAGFQGPLAGIEACLQHAGKEPVLIVPADMPDLPEDLPQRLLERLDRNSIAVAHDGKQTQVLCLAMYPDTWRASLSTYLDTGNRGVNRWLSNKPIIQVRFDDVAKFSNINEKSDLCRQNGQIIRMDALSALIGYDQRHDHQSCQ
jgi:molybdenum cofactor guanylyltransferase